MGTTSNQPGGLISARKIAWIAAVVLVAVPGQAWAIPSPDALVHSAGLGAYLWGILGGAVALLVGVLQRRFKGAPGTVWDRRLATIFLGLWMVTAGYLVYVMSGDSSDSNFKRAAEIEFRCDMAYHQSRRLSHGPQREFNQRFVRRVGYAQLRTQLMADPDPLLIDIRLPFWFASGHFRYRDHAAGPRSFRNVYASELPALLTREAARGKRAVYLVSYRPIPMMYFSESQRRELFAALDKLDKVYHFVLDKGASPRDRRAMAGDLVVGPVTGEPTRAADIDSTAIPWPAIPDSYLLDEARVRYPNVGTVLSVPKLASAVRDDDTWIVATFSSWYRGHDVYVKALRTYLRDKPSGRVVVVDYSAPNVRQHIRTAAQAIGSDRFAVVGYAKFDTNHYGLDFAFQVWEEGRRNGIGFGFAGYSVQLPEAIAHQALAERSTWARLERRGRAWSLSATSRLARITGSVGLALILLGFLLKLLLTPIGLAATASRARRRVIAGFVKRASRDPEQRYLLEHQSLFEQRFKCRRSVEALDAAINLLVVLPLFAVFGRASEDLSASSFLWLDDLSKPDAWLAALVLAVAGGIGLVATLGRSTPPTGRKRWGSGIGMAILFALCWYLLSMLAAAVLLIALGLVTVRLLEETRARVATRRVLAEALLIDDARPAAARAALGAIPLGLTPDDGSIGNKAARLAALIRTDSPLFRVPRGLVIGAALATKLRDAGASDRRAQVESLTGELSRVASGPYAVRSCAAAEDSSHESMAGRFHTELSVDADGLDDAIARVDQSMVQQADLAADDVAILVQQMVLTPDYSGVLFSRSPDNAAMTLIELVEGLPDALVSGRARPRRFRVGRFSGSTAGDAGSFGKMLAHVYLVGRLLENRFGGPQDIEWAYDVATETLFLLQCRDVTALAYDEELAEEQQRLLRIAGAGSGVGPAEPVFRAGDFRVVAAQPSPFTASLIARLHSPAGALGIALDTLGLRNLAARPNEPAPLESVFGELYANQHVEAAMGRFELRGWLARRRISRELRGGGIRFFEAILAFVDAAESCPPNPVGSDPAALAAGILAQLEHLSCKLYPSVYLATLLAQASAHTADDSSAEIPATIEGRVSGTSRGTELAFALGELAGGADVEGFIRQWGHRSRHDYDLAQPSFADDPASAQEYAERFLDFPAPKATETSSSADRFRTLKELGKDESLRLLRQVQPAMLRLADALSLDPADVYGLTWSALEALAAGELDGAAAADVAAGNQRRYQSFRALRFGDTISVLELERLRPAGSDETMSTVGAEFVTRPSAFSGRARRVGEHSEWGAGDVVMARHLTPDLVGLFGRTAGCIAEVGGSLSHAAIVAREIGYPILIASDAQSIPAGAPLSVTRGGEIVLGGESE